MKFLLIFLTFLSTQFLCYSEVELELTPVNINFHEIYVVSNNFYVLGDFGSYLYGENEGETWQQIKAFERGLIVAMFHTDNEITAFNSFGDIARSIDEGKTWELKAKLADSVLSVIQYTEGYLLRAETNLILLDSQFSKLNEYELISPKISSGSTRVHGHRKRMIFKNNNLIVADDSTRLLFFDNDLNLIKTVHLIDDFPKLFPHSKVSYIHEDGGAYYLSVGNVVLKTNDFENFEEKYSANLDMSVFDGRPIVLDCFFQQFPSVKNFVCSVREYTGYETNDYYQIEYKYRTGAIKLKDYLVYKNKIYCVGDDKVILWGELYGDELHVISDFSDVMPSALPTKTDEGEYIFFAPDFFGGTFRAQIYRTDDDATTLRPLLEDNESINVFRECDFSIKYFDKENETFYCGGRDYRLFREAIFEFKENEGVVKQNDDPEFKFDQQTLLNGLMRKPNTQRRKDELYTAYYSTYAKDFKYVSKICSIDFDLKVSEELSDTGFVNDYINVGAEGEYLVHGYSVYDEGTQIKYTEDNGETWSAIKTYTQTDWSKSYLELEIGEKPFVFFFYLDETDSTMFIDALDIGNKRVETIYEYRAKWSSYDLWQPFENSICVKQDTIYIAIRDTIFTTTDLYDKENWNKIILPNNGRIWRIFRNEGERFFATYSDDNNPRNYFWIKIRPKEVQYPEILSDDVDFGKIYLNETFKEKKVKITNKSKDEDLMIYSFLETNPEIFVHNLPDIEKDKPLIIGKDTSFEYTVKFQPKAPGEFLDSIIFHTNAIVSDSISIFRAEYIDTTTSVEYEIAELKENYLYLHKPFPNPSNNSIRILIYWSPLVEFDIQNVGIYDLNGTRIINPELIIEKLNVFSGYLIWDCTGISPGVYIVSVLHGSKRKSVKVLIGGM